MAHQELMSVQLQCSLNMRAAGWGLQSTQQIILRKS